jgi:hypothetical protein
MNAMNRPFRRDARAHSLSRDSKSSERSAPSHPGDFRKSPGCGPLRACLVIVFALAGATNIARGDEQTYILKNDDLSVFVDANWVGGGQGGYFPLRIRAVNTGPSRELTFRFRPARGHNIPAVQSSVQTEQNRTVRLELLIPMVGSGSAGTLEVLDGGKVIDDLKQDLRLPTVDSGGAGSPSVLVVSDGQVALKPLERAATYLSMQLPRPYRGLPSGSITLDAQSIPPASLPLSWVAYTTVDLAFVDLGVLGRISPERRQVLLNWVKCGGTLVVYNVGSPPDRSPELATLLELKNRGGAPRRWQPAVVAFRDLAQVALDKAVQLELTNVGGVRFGARRRRPVGAVVVPKKLVAAHNWPGREDAFFQRELMYGLIVAFPGDPFRGTEYDWAWLLQSVGPHRYQWATRHGFSARKDTDDFQDFLIPGVRGVPVYAFLFLITAFTILIGPLNYILLWRRKRLFLLVMTVPVIAFATSVVLFGYSMVSQGFSVKSRARSLTILDQKSQDAVTVSRVAMFAGLPPSGGLRYSPDTAVFPIWPAEKEFENGRVDWSDGQALTSGWLRSRTRTQFLTVNHRRERGRLEISGPVDGKLKVANGFEWSIEALLVADRNGNPYYAADLRPGETAELSPATKADRQQLDALLRHPLEAPDEVKDNRRDRHRRSPFSFGRRRRYRYTELPVKYSDNLVERRISEFLGIRLEGSKLDASSYLAVFAENPGLNVGVDDPTEFDGYHLLLGYY